MTFKTPRLIRQTYTAEKAEEEISGEWVVALIYRQLSFYITSLLTPFKVSSNQVTYFSGLLCLLLLVFAVSDYSMSYLVVGCIATFILVLDCVDGNLARLNNETSDYGGFLDFFIDIIYKTTLYLAIAFLISSESVNALNLNFPFVYSYIAITSTLIARLCRMYPGMPQKTSKITTATSTDKTYSFLSGLDHLTPLLLIVSGYFSSIEYVLVWITFYAFCDMLISFSIKSSSLR